MKEALLSLAAAIRGYTAEMKRYHDDVDRRYQGRKTPKQPKPSKPKLAELAAYIETLEPGTLLQPRKLAYYGSSMTVARYLRELSNPLNPRVRKTEDNRWVVVAA